MDRITLNYNGKTYENFSYDELIERGLPDLIVKKAFEEHKLSDLRQQRNQLHSETDWTQIPDAPLTPEKQIEYSSYRQALRDITNNLDNPDEVTWPIKPA